MGHNGERSTVATALRSGKLVRPDHCERCFAICIPDAHHEDYTKPLDIVWACRKCHGLTWRINDAREIGPSAAGKRREGAK